MGYDPDEPRDSRGRWSRGLQDSLEHQLKARGHTPDKARELAKEILINRGHMDASGQLTPAGREREAMGRKARRIDRHARMTGHDEKEIGYQRGKVFVKR